MFHSHSKLGILFRDDCCEATAGPRSSRETLGPLVLLSCHEFWCYYPVITAACPLFDFLFALLRNGDLQLCQVWQRLLQCKLQRHTEDYKEASSIWLFCVWWLLYPWDHKQAAPEVLQSRCASDFWHYISTSKSNLCFSCHISFNSLINFL